MPEPATVRLRAELGPEGSEGAIRGMVAPGEGR